MASGRGQRGPKGPDRIRIPLISQRLDFRQVNPHSGVRSSRQASVHRPHSQQKEVGRLTVHPQPRN